MQLVTVYSLFVNIQRWVDSLWTRLFFRRVGWIMGEKIGWKWSRRGGEGKCFICPSFRPSHRARQYYTNFNIMVRLINKIISQNCLLLQKSFSSFAAKFNVSFIIKQLDSAVIRITHNYPSITNICCTYWIHKRSTLANFTSKLHIKTLHPVIKTVCNLDIAKAIESDPCRG